MATVSSTWTETDLGYPSSDGKPMAEDTLQYQWIVTIKEGLERWLSGDREAFVAADLFWYPVEGDRRTRVAPDVMVAFGRPKGDRRSYLQWREGGIAPQVVFEILSKGNRRAEMARKLAFYDRFQVQEYYIHDPHRNRLHGWIREGEQLVPIAGMAGWVSPLLGIRFEPGPVELTVVRPDGEVFKTVQEIMAHAESTALRAEAEAATAALERRNARAAALRADEERRKADEERRKADEERRKADEERRKADEERERALAADQRALAADEKAERLAEKLRAMGLDPDED